MLDVDGEEIVSALWNDDDLRRLRGGIGCRYCRKKGLLIRKLGLYCVGVRDGSEVVDVEVAVRGQDEG